MYTARPLAILALTLLLTAITAAQAQAQAQAHAEEHGQAQTRAAAEAAPSTALDGELAAIQARWATLKYETLPEDGRLEAYHSLAASAAALTGRYPGRAEPLIWEGIVLSTAAGDSGGLDALRLAKKARDRLEAALAIDDGALAGSAHTSLGALYHKVPRFPLGFGSDRKARAHFEAALAYDPAGIDANYFYGEFLAEEGEIRAAVEHLDAAFRAAPRPGRATADAGRRREVTDLLTELRTRLPAAAPVAIAE